MSKTAKAHILKAYINGAVADRILDANGRETRDLQEMQKVDIDGTRYALSEQDELTLVLRFDPAS